MEVRVIVRTYIRHTRPRARVELDWFRQQPSLRAAIEKADRILRPIRGIGELYVYDTSLRIGAKLNLLPTKVYLHAGTRVGARALGLDSHAASLQESELPQEFRPLKPHEIEDILCIFKNKFKPAGPKLITGEFVNRSWCT